MKNTLKRACIYPKDVQRITGKSYRQSLRILQQIRNVLRKEKHQIVTVDEFCSFMGFDNTKVEELLF
jgi:ATP:corrinoid adenosyltransferase